MHDSSPFAAFFLRPKCRNYAFRFRNLSGCSNGSGHISWSTAPISGGNIRRMGIEVHCSSPHAPLVCWQQQVHSSLLRCFTPVEWNGEREKKEALQASLIKASLVAGCELAARRHTAGLLSNIYPAGKSLARQLLLRLLAVPADVASLPVRTDLVHWPDASAFFKFYNIYVQQRGFIIPPCCYEIGISLTHSLSSRFAPSAAPKKPKVHFCQCAATNFILTCEVVAVWNLRNDRLAQDFFIDYHIDMHSGAQM